MTREGVPESAKRERPIGSTTATASGLWTKSCTFADLV
jgi:hypothetical protein